LTAAGILAWLVVSALALLIIVVGGVWFELFAVLTMGATMWTIRFFVQSFYVVTGLLWLGFFILMEHLLMGPAAKAGLLLPRALFTIGIELLLLSAIQIGRVGYGNLKSDWLSWSLIVIQALLGVGMIWFSRRKPRPAGPTVKTGV
jgi:hypothetical protein